MQIGFVGLGIMGRPMANNLMKAGHQLFVYGKRTVPPEIREGATVCDTLKAIAAQAETIIVMVPDTPDVENVLFSADGVASGLATGKTVIDMSSISPIETKRFAAEIAKKGCDYVDAPVSGGEVGAKAASLTIMVLLFAAKAGADPAKVREALMGGFASSRILEVHGERMIKRTFDPGFRIELHQKDLSLALSGARALNLSLPNTATTQELFNAAAALGGKGWDHSGLVRVLEHLAGHQVAKG